jgi:hypothetical protein
LTRRLISTASRIIITIPRTPPTTTPIIPPFDSSTSQLTSHFGHALNVDKQSVNAAIVVEFVVFTVWLKSIEIPGPVNVVALAVAVEGVVEELGLLMRVGG